jgi:hypothetical protein
MRSISRLFYLLLAIAISASCSSPPAKKRPAVYHGGLYYGDALHAEDLQNH